MLCLNCGKETKHPKFCNRSCAASYNNKGVRRHKGPKPTCLYCGTNTKDSSKKYCNIECQHNHQYKTRITEWKEGKRTIPGRHSIRRYLSSIKEGCWECGITDWNNKPIVLELEHIDGNADNNDEENLSLLCPNCHSQTDTYKGKNAGNGRHSRRKRYIEGKSY